MDIHSRKWAGCVLFNEFSYHCFSIYGLCAGFLLFWAEKVISFELLSYVLRWFSYECSIACFGMLQYLSYEHIEILLRRFFESIALIIGSYYYACVAFAVSPGCCCLHYHNVDVYFYKLFVQ